MMAVQAQDYTSAIGLRGGFYGGLTFKHFLSEKMAFEGLLTAKYRGINFTALAEFHNSISEVDGLKWYYGFGGHIGFYNNNYYYNNYLGSDNYLMIIGVDGILGLEYTFDFIPFNLSLDWKPVFNLIGASYFTPYGGALSVRYCFE